MRTGSMSMWQCTTTIGFVLASTIWARADAPTSTASAPTRAPDERPRLAVVGIVPAPDTDPRDTWLSVAFEELLTWRLRRVPTLVTMPTMRVYQACQELADPNEPPPWPRLLRALGVRWWLSGFCTGPADEAILQLALLRLDDPNAAPERTIFPPGRWSDVADQATRWVLARLGVLELPTEVAERVSTLPTRSASALEYYSRAVAAMRDDRPRDALHFAREAVECDGKFRSALGLLAQIEMGLGEAGRTSAARRLRVVGDLARREGDLLDRANAELALSLVARADASLEAAHTRAQTALELATRLRDVYGELAALTWLADLHAAWPAPADESLPAEERSQCVREHLQQAVAYQRQLLEVLQSIEDAVAALPATTKLALLYERTGDVDSALTCHQRALAMAQALNARRHEASAWLYLGQWYGSRKRWNEAVDAMRRCLELADETSRPAAHIALGVLYQSMSEPAKALAEFESAYGDCRKREDLPAQFTCLREMARARRQLGQHAEALANLRDALDIAEALELSEKEQLRAELEEWKRQSP